MAVCCMAHLLVLLDLRQLPLGLLDLVLQTQNERNDCSSTPPLPLSPRRAVSVKPHNSMGAGRQPLTLEPPLILSSRV